MGDLPGLQLLEGERPVSDSPSVPGRTRANRLTALPDFSAGEQIPDCGSEVLNARQNHQFPTHGRIYSTSDIGALDVYNTVTTSKVN